MGAAIGSVAFFILWIVCLVQNVRIAKRKNRSVALWVILSIFFSWIALIINALTDPKAK